MDKLKKSNRFVVGLTGRNASGKGEAGLVLQKHGYQYLSLSDVLRDEAALRRLEPSREVLISLGKELREQGGPGVLAKKTIEKLGEGHYAIDSIRNPKEIEFLRQSGNFLLLGIDAPIEIRFARAQKRGRNENASTLEDFREMENREHSSRNPAQQLDLCMNLVDEVVQNDKDLSNLSLKLSEVIRRKQFPWN